MKSFSLLILLAPLVAHVWADSPQYPGFDKPLSPRPGYQLVDALSDEFNGTCLDTGKWVDHMTYWDGRGAKFLPSNISVGDGCLKLKASVQDEAKLKELYTLIDAALTGSRKEVDPETWSPASGGKVWQPDPLNKPEVHQELMKTGMDAIGAAAVMSKARIAKAGYYEARIKASNIAMSSSFWLQGGGTEFDITESYGNITVENPAKWYQDRPYTISTSVWWNQAPPGTPAFKTVDWVAPRKVTDEFFVLGFLWNETEVKVYFNDQEILTRNLKEVPAIDPHLFASEKHVIFDTEILNGSYFGWPTRSQLRDPAKNTFHVDWIRVWEPSGNKTSPFGKAQWIAPPVVEGPREGTALLRREFNLIRLPRRAVLRVVGLGDYDPTLNGQRLSPIGINQPWSQYERTLYYREFDVLPHLRKGANCLGVTLTHSFWDNAPAPHGRYFKGGPQRKAEELQLLLAALELENPDGSILTIASDDTWRSSPGPIVFSHIFAGEDFDARKVQPGWDAPGFTDAGWAAVRKVAAPAGELRPQTWPPVLPHERFAPTRIVETAPGVWLYEFPQNCAAQLRIEVSGGQPLEEAGAQAAKLLQDYRVALAPALQPKAAPVEKKFHLTVDGKSDCVIVVNAVHKPAGNGMSGNAWFAATEFQKYVKRMSGAELAIIALADNATAELEALQGKPVIAIGASAFTRRLGILTDGMVEDGFQIRVTPAHLSIVGHDALTWWSEQKGVPIASGTLHGVYHLLRELGVRTFFEDESLDVIPDRKTVSLDAGEIKDAPFFPFRCGSGGAWGYKAGYGGNLDPWPTRHSFANAWLKITLDGKETNMDWWSRYRESHPEYFAVDPKGNRMSMLRFTEPAVQQQIVRDASAWFEKGEDYYSLLQNDGYTDIDQSPETQRLIDPSRGLQGLLSEAVMRPFIGIASKLYESHPGKTVSLGAYSCYAYPPKGIKALPPNAAVMLALQRLNNIVPQGAAVNRQLLDDWIKLNPKELYLWEYYCFDSWRWRTPHYEIFPRYLPRTIAEDIRHLAAVRERYPNFRGQWMFGERRADDANAWWHVPNMYVTGRLFWNPKLDIDVLLEDFHSKAFGDAAGEMRAFYNLCEKTASAGMAGLYARKPPVITYQGGSLNEAASMGYDYIDGHFTLDDFLSVWNPGVIGKLRRMIDEASRKAKETPSEARVEWVRKHFKSLEDIVVKNSPPGLPTTASDWKGYTKHAFASIRKHAGTKK